MTQLGERLNGMQTPLSVVANRSPITIDTSGIAKAIARGCETMTALIAISESSARAAGLRPDRRSDDATWPNA